MRQFLTGALVGSVIAVCAGRSMALPRFALMQGAKCQSCHLNPTGGGIRSEVGMIFSSDKLPLEASKDDEFTFSGKLTENISIGGDHRGQFIYDNASKTSSFQAMTTSIYGSIQLNKKYSFSFKQDLVNSGYGYLSGPEIFGLAKIFSGWYVKGGVFMPNYGWRLDDHTAYTRGGDLGIVNNNVYNDGLIFTPNYKDVGIEIGGYIGNLFLSGGIFNGDGNKKQISFNNKKTYVLKAEYLGSISDVNFSLGVSTYGSDSLAMTGITPGSIKINGVTAGFGVGNFTLLGEFDVTKNYATGNPAFDTRNPGGNTMAAHLEADYRIIQGLWLIGMYDIFDPIQGISETDIKRITMGVEFFPYSFVEVRPQYRHLVQEDPSVSDNVLLVQMHLWF